MTIARRKQICLDITPVYHCVSRCVRRSFLCGYDKLTRRNYYHRRAWIEDRLLLDGCKGAFWESRFKLQAVLDVAALLQTLCYVDLNPVRAKMAKTPEDSKYTSVRRRLHHGKDGLMKFGVKGRSATTALLSSMNGIPVSFKHYLELLDWTGRQLRKGKRGSIDENAPSIMSRLGYTPEKWLAIQTPQLSWKQKALGNVERIKDYCEAIGQRWIWQQA